ncbi:HSDL2 protein, partial [Cisticola juncidis]|nr:HSDL2 protein [Cisticola juncidis]
GPVAETFRVIQGAVTEDYVRSTQGVFQFELSGKSVACAALPSKRHGVFSARNPLEERQCQNFNNVKLLPFFLNKLKPFMAFLTGNSSIKGDMMLILSLEKML